jgi:DNA-binding HxlR family transcriptional regulator
MWPFSKKKSVDIESLFKELELKMDCRFTELKSQINELEIKLMTKDLKDKQQYGLLHYKIHEMKETPENSGENPEPKNKKKLIS